MSYCNPELPGPLFSSLGDLGGAFQDRLGCSCHDDITVWHNYLGGCSKELPLLWVCHSCDASERDQESSLKRSILFSVCTMVSRCNACLYSKWWICQLEYSWTQCLLWLVHAPLPPCLPDLKGSPADWQATTFLQSTKWHFESHRIEGRGRLPVFAVRIELPHNGQLVGIRGSLQNWGKSHLGTGITTTIHIWEIQQY